MSEGRHVVCPNCLQTNRVPLDRPAEVAKCGKCHTRLFRGEPLHLTSHELAKRLAEEDLPLLVDFWAAWCAPCRMMEPVLAKAAEALEPQVRVAKLDTEQFPDVAGRYGIRAIPTMILFKDGRELARISGAMDLQRLLAWVYRNLEGGIWTDVAGRA